MTKVKRRNIHKEIIDPAIEYFTGQGAVCQNYHSPRAMPGALAGHPDLVIVMDGTIWFVEVKPDTHGRPSITDTQCIWFWKFMPQFCYNVRYIIAQNYDDLIWRVESRFDISVPEWYHQKLTDFKDKYAQSE